MTPKDKQKLPVQGGALLNKKGVMSATKQTADREKIKQLHRKKEV